MSKTKSLLTITCLLLLLTLSAKAQQAITPAGGNATGSGGSMSYTIGQIDFVMAVSTGGSMAQGVQHPYSDATTTGPIVGPSHLCEGASTTYTNITHGGIWTSGNTAVATIGSATGILNSLSGGVTIISYYVPGSGSIAVFANVTVDTLPNTGIITGPSSVCAGSQITLSNVPVDGTWSAAAPGILTIGIDNGIVTGIAAGAAMVTYVATNACGQDSAVATITVDPLPDAGSISGAASMCEGDTITLTNSSGGGTWSSGASGIAVVGSPGIVFGISGGNTTISYTVTNGCGNDYATHLLSVNPLVPDAGIITGPNSVVIDSTITLTNATGSGTWNASNANVTISPSGVVTGVSAGTVVISYTIGTECGSNVATKIVTVNVPLGPITGTLTLCQGTTTTLSSTVAGGSWFTSNFSVAAVSGTGVVTGASAGTATITYILSTNYVTATVTVYPLPAAITGAGSVCAGSTIILSSTTPDGVWSSSLPEIATIDAVTGIVTGIIAGTVVISYTPGCSVTRIITVNAAPNAGTISGTTTMCVAANRTLSSTVSGGTWSSSATSIATIGTSGIVTGVSAGTALISYIVTNSCGSVFDTVIVTIHAPGAGTITGSSSVNTGSIITLTNTTTGGTWSSSNTAIATVGSTGVVAGVSPGTVTISYSVSNSCGSTSATKIVSVNVLLETPITGTFTVCTGATTTLSNATPGGTWSSGNTAVATVVAGTGVVTGISAGTAVISYTLFGTSVTTIITVNAAMSVASITGTSSFCAGATSALASTTTGGTWSSSNTTIATVGSTGIVAGISGGTAGITYTATGICGTGYAVMIVEILSLPAPLSGTATVCEGASTELSSSPGGGTWSSSNTTKATIDAGTGIATGISAGSTTITYTAGTGCYSTRQVTVLTTPAVITGTLSTCTGSTTTLSSATSGGTWSSGHLLNATVASGTGVVTGVATGTATISYSLGSGCRRKVTVTVIATPAAITGSMSLCAGNSSALSSATTGGSWSTGATGIATINTSTGVVTGVSAGTAIITYSTGSCSRTATVTVNAATGANTGNALLCAGQASALSNSTSGGTWSSSDAAVATVAASTGLVTGIGAGTANITYMLSAGCYSLTEVTVNAAVASITGTLSACPGTTTALASATTGGTWSSSNTTKATIDAGTGIATGISAGSTTITYLVSAACYKTATLTVHAAPGNIGGTASFCSGGSATLSCSPGGGTWSSSTTSVATIGSTGVVTTISAGTTIISYTNSNGCAATKIVTVHAMPTAITGTLLVCIGNTSTLASTPGGGTWSSYFTTRASINATTGVVTGVSIGTTHVTYTAPGGCRTTAIVTVGTTPAAITGILTVCVGNNTTLNSATTGGTWSSSDGTIATVAAGIVTGISTGTATISYTNGTCFRTTTVTVNAAPGANTGTAVVCVGQGTALSNTTGGGTWSSSNTARATVNAATGIVTGVSAGTVNISYSISAGCYSITVVTVNAAPANITGSLSVCPGASTTLSHAVSGGVWTSSNTAIGTIDAGTGVATGITFGSTIITYTLGTGCFRTAALTVNTAPGAITGTAAMCAGATTTLACSPGGGTWSSTTPSVATISSTGLVNGIAAGNSTISYTNSGGCAAIRQVTVSATPGSIGGTLTACTGSTTTLSAAPGGGTWSSSNTSIASIGSATGIVTGESTGTATITYSLSATCFVIATATINTTPATITGILTVCTACNTTLSSLTGGGVWSSAATGIATIGAGTGIVSGVSTGTATISYILGGCSRTIVVSVNAAISPSYGTPVVCVGQTNATMGNPVPGGTWSSGNTAIVTIHAANGLLTGIGVGNANITYTTSPGMYTITVATVSPAVATITGTANICPGATVTLLNATSGGAWSSTNTASATVGAGTGIVTAVAAGTATISYFINVGCYKSITQVVNSVPNVTGASTVVNGASTTFGGSPGGGTWSSANPAIASVSGAGVVTGNSIAATTITYTLSTGCFASRGITVVTSRPSSGGAESITQQAGHIKVYPNPTSGTLIIESGISGVFTVFTIDGKEVEQYAVAKQATTVSLPQHLAAGVYMCRFNGADGTTAIVRLVYER